MTLCARALLDPTLFLSPPHLLLPHLPSPQVTAQKWVPIIEVKPAQLESFLLERRAAGYALIGVEQTARSVSIEYMEFPARAVVVLGKEKEGIPAQFLRLLDQCIEIPQLGIIRCVRLSSLSLSIAPSPFDANYFAPSSRLLQPQLTQRARLRCDCDLGVYPTATAAARSSCYRRGSSRCRARLVYL